MKWVRVFFGLTTQSVCVYLGLLFLPSTSFPFLMFSSFTLIKHKISQHLLRSHPVSFYLCISKIVFLSQTFLFSCTFLFECYSFVFIPFRNAMDRMEIICRKKLNSIRKKNVFISVSFVNSFGGRRRGVCISLVSW